MDGNPVAERLPLARLNPVGLKELWFSSPLDVPLGVWTLRQAGEVVGTISQAAGQASRLELAGECWTAGLGRNWRGWWMEFSRAGTGETISYHPRGLRGGAFASGSRTYRLRLPLFGGKVSTLENDVGAPLASIARHTAVRGETRIGIGEAAVGETRLLVLILASCLVIAREEFPGGGGGG